MKRLSDCRVLLVDDTKANLEVLVAGLRADYKLSVALSGEAALQLAARAVPDLVLLDVMMPGMDGYEVCRQFRARAEMAEVPIVFLSALDEVHNKALGFEVGANDYITKPFDLLEVKARVRALLKAKAYNEAVKEQIAGELRVAREIQMGMLPQDFSSLQIEYGVTVQAQLLPAGEVGGDLFAAFGVGSRLVVVMGDVSGKGIPAALFMVRTLSLVRLLAREIADPAAVLHRLNNELATDNPFGMFVTLVCAMIEPTSGRLTLASGGQTRPILLRAGTAPLQLLDGLGTALGLEAGITFVQKTVDLQPADTLVFYTDGVTEAFNQQGDCYGHGRLLGELASSPDRSPAQITGSLLASVQSFSAGTGQSDDIAVLAVRLPGAPRRPPAAHPRRVALEFHATPQEVMRAVEAIRVFGQDHNLTESEVFGLALALEECGSNIVRHGCQGDATQTFQVSFERSDHALSVVLSDAGPAVDRHLLDEPLSPPLPTGGGWGLHLARKFVDQFEYARRANRNTWRLTVRLPAKTNDLPLLPANP